MVAQEYTTIDPRVQGLQRGAMQTAQDQTSRFGPALSRVQQALILGAQRTGAQVQGQLGRQGTLAGMQAGMQEQQFNQNQGAAAFENSQAREQDILQSLAQRFQRREDLSLLEGNANTAQSRAIGGAIMRGVGTVLGGLAGSSSTGAYAGELGANAFA
jgi:hypothetical protein